MELADAHGFRSLAFPSISTGIYGFPIALAAPIAFREVQSHFAHGTDLEGILFCCFSEEDLAVYQDLLKAG